MRVPFRITGYTFTEVKLLQVTISDAGATGQGEATGVYYLNETGEGMLAQVESIRSELEGGLDREQLRTLLPAGGARNAIDCALWDLEAKQSGRRVWEMAGITPARTLTVNTVGIGTPAEMAAVAGALDTSKIKVKLDGEQPLECIAAVREARPDAEIVVDINQGWTFAQLVELAPRFAELDIAMIEQPLPRGADEALEDYQSPVMLCADESCLDSSEFEQAARRYQMINIKLDKTGGLTEALTLAAMARERGVELMVGNMVGTSLAMAPGFVVAQLCRFVDLDGALVLTRDREPAMDFSGGVVSPPDRALWG
ncbi:dipeptide epimerase [Kineobactrum salinum]|uniref:Dipeptide epimerase n=1 Tax=Kineobactrum salinum TaxID=2708301 RepID=A0A6C0U5U8_9GAMM|nr:dipeptide epimerase [Kineobactrum salinum]